MNDSAAYFAKAFVGEGKDPGTAIMEGAWMRAAIAMAMGAFGMCVFQAYPEKEDREAFINMWIDKFKREQTKHVDKFVKEHTGHMESDIGKLLAKAGGMMDGEEVRLKAMEPINKVAEQIKDALLSASDQVGA